MTVDRDAKVDARISKSLKQELIQIAQFRDMELSDVLREAFREKVQRFKQQTQIAAGI